jgi:hypothetical protein
VEQEGRRQAHQGQENAATTKKQTTGQNQVHGGWKSTVQTDELDEHQTKSQTEPASHMIATDAVV